MEELKLNELKSQLESASKIITGIEEQDKSAIEIKQEEEITEERIKKDINKIKEETTTITDKYKIPKEYITSVAKGFHKAMIFLGSSGIGKSFLTRQVLARLNINFVESRGVNSPLGLYEFLYEHREEDNVIVFDDTCGLINSPFAYSILLGILWEGIANWNSTSDKLKIPKKFIFNGKIIIIANKLEGENSEVVKSRCLTYELKMNRDELVEMMYEIAKNKHNKLTYKERKDIVDFIKENTDKSMRFDLRTQQKIEQLYLYDKDNWKELSMPLLERDDDYTFLIECLDKHNNVKNAEIEWCRATGRHRATFYRLKKELNEKSQLD